MKKLLYILFGFLFICNAYAAQIVNVEYIHNLISQEWDITVPYNPALTNVKTIANMKYLLTAVDVANEILNGEKTSNYGNTEFATTRIADTIATIQAVETLVRKIDKGPEFTLTTTPDTTSFSFSISAAGEFYVDWGDGTVETITKPDTTDTIYSHNYDTANTYTIGLSGQATAYNTDEYTAAISFYVNSSQTKIASIDGSLGAIFGTLSSDINSQPRFYQTFYKATNMTGSIPANLFAGISGAPATIMFLQTFRGCSGLTSIPAGLFAGISGAPAISMFNCTFQDCTGLTSIPAGLFAGISGAPAVSMFAQTFSGCSGLTGAIPDGLFGNLTGAPANHMFQSTFKGCSGLTGTIPADLFAGISGAPASYMFYETFRGCTGLTSIPENLFGNISGTAQSNMFYKTFYYCTSLTGPSARINGQYLYEIWPSATSFQVGDMYSDATGLDDYRCIPTVWGGGGEDCSAPTAEFTLTTTDDTDSFSFNISAAGEFVVDWGDGTVETITKPDTTDTTYSHDYTTAGAYTIGLGGQATAYNTDEYTAAISFEASSYQIASIDGSLGAIFGTLPDATEKQPRFVFTFYYASNMKGSIPENLFTGIYGAPAESMFDGTFYGCSGLTGAIPAGLFAGISGAPARYMFNDTFSYCSGLTGAIPDGLFAGISGAPASSMFAYTFLGCSGLTSIPENLFAGISGAPAGDMFASTFYGCSGLTSIPDGLFGNLTGAPAEYMFYNTFYDCTSLTGPSARINGQYLYEIWPDATEEQVEDMYYNATGLDDYRCIPTVWGGGGEDCSAPTAEFTLTTTPDTSSFEFSISAAGEFVVDWGDGTVETITKPDTTDTIYSHNYDTANTYTIGLSGQATAYNTDEYTATISFFPTALIASIDGSLGAIFGTLSSDTNNQPRFYGTFFNAHNMTGSIPSDLFAGISGAPASYMFYQTFYLCSGLTSIPENLFAGISGAPARSMFNSTFAYCIGLTSIPENLFGDISGTAQYQMFDGMFMRCTSLTGPSARINGQYLYEIWPTYPGWFYGAYIGCTGLSDYSTMPTMWKTDD